MRCCLAVTFAWHVLFGFGFAALGVYGLWFIGFEEFNVKGFSAQEVLGPGRHSSLVLQALGLLVLACGPWLCYNRITSMFNQKSALLMSWKFRNGYVVLGYLHPNPTLSPYAWRIMGLGK